MEQDLDNRLAWDDRAVEESRDRLIAHAAGRCLQLTSDTKAARRIAEELFAFYEECARRGLSRREMLNLIRPR